MKMKELLAKPENWVQGRTAVDAKGNNVAPASGQAMCFCLVGAMFRCYPERTEQDEVRQKLRTGVFATAGHTDVVGWNDSTHRTHKDVLDLVTALDV